VSGNIINLAARTLLHNKQAFLPIMMVIMQRVLGKVRVPSDLYSGECPLRTVSYEF
jgi:hypothetical protein